MRWFRLIPFALLALPLAAQTTTVTISNTVALACETATGCRTGVNMGGDAPFGAAQLLKSFNPYGYMQSAYWQTSYACTTGGTNDTTHWYNNATDTSGYAANFWVGATYNAVSANTGTSYGTGIITASTTNTGATGIEFTLGTAISSACSTSQQDMLIVKQINPTYTLNVLSPQSFGISTCGGATWNTTDTSPASSNTIQSLEMPASCNTQFGSDQGIVNATNTNGTLAATQVNWINLNASGSDDYTFTFKAKCIVAGCTIGYVVGRQGGTTFLNSSVTPTFNATPGSGWTTYSFTFAASETGTVTEGTLQYTLSTGGTGTALVQDMDIIEGTTLSGNNTAYRDSVVRKLQAIKPGSIRFMDGGDWCSNIPDMLTVGQNPVAGAPWIVQGNNRACGMNEYVPAAVQVPLGYYDKLQLCLFINADCWLTIGQFNLPTDWTTLINWLGNSADGPTSGTSWITAFSNAGLKIYLEEGNEAWNSGAAGGLWAGGGTTYGYFLGPNMAAAKAASGYNSSVIKLVADGSLASGTGVFSWTHNALTVAQGTSNGLPDFIDQATYTLDDLTSFATSGSNISTTGAPFPDTFAEIANLNTPGISPSNPSTSAEANCAYALSTFSVKCAVYETNNGLGGGATVTQLQMDQVVASVGEALSVTQNWLLHYRDAGVTGPVNIFQLAQNEFQYNCYYPTTCSTSAVPPIWGIERYMAAGPAQLGSFTDVDRPDSILLQLINNAIGSNSNLMSITQSGTPTFSYPGGQPYGSSIPADNTIAANSAVPYVNCFTWANTAKIQWTTICYNNDVSNTHAVSLAGSGAPTGTVTQWTYPASGENIITHNEDTYIGPSSISPQDVAPSSTSTSGTSYTIPAASAIILTYATGSQASAPSCTPTSGSSSSPITVTCTNGNSGTTIMCYTENGTTPVTNGAGTGCSTGTSLSGASNTITISSTVTTLNVVAGTSTLADSTASSYGPYTITTTSSFSLTGKVSMTGHVVIN